MIISHKHKWVFLHNPKVAGSAIRKALEHFHDDPTIFWHQKYFPQLDRVVDAAHLTYHDACLVVPCIRQNGYRFLMVNRDPYARFPSSVAEHLRQHPEQQTLDWNLDKWLSENMDETNFRFNWKYIHLCPQHYFAPGISEESYQVRHENLSSNWKDALAFLFREQEELFRDIELPHVRVRPDPEGTLKPHQLSPLVVREINKLYHQDFYRFAFKMLFESGNPPDSHYERVNGIHSPYHARPDPTTCTPGELIAYRQLYGME